MFTIYFKGVLSKLQMMCDYRNCRGYTLIELVVVISLLGLMAGIALPDFKKNAANSNLKTAAFELAENIRLAQQKSIAEGLPYKIVIDLERGDNYQILAGKQGKLVKLPKNVIFSWTSYTNVGKTIIFGPSGAPNQGGTIALTNGDNTIYVIISVATGRVRIDKTPPRI